MKKAFVYAYDHINLGDDLFVRNLVNRYPHVQFYIWSDKKNKHVFKSIQNLKVIDKESGFLKTLHKIRPSLVVRYQESRKSKCDAVIYIGGSIFMEYPTWRNIVNWWRYQVQNYQFYVLGANFGPYQTEEYRKEMGEIMGNMQDICFRDQYSHQLFSDIPMVRYAPDLLFSYPMPQVESKKKQVCISVINCQRKEDGKFKKAGDKYEKILCKIIDSFLKEDFSILLVSFCREEGDEEAAKRLSAHFAGYANEEQIRLLNYDGLNDKKVLYELAASEFVVATRFHAIILSLAAGRSVYPILYSDKTKHVLQDIGFLGNFLNMKNLDEFEISKVWENYGKGCVTDIGRLIQESEDHFAKLDKVLR